MTIKEESDLVIKLISFQNKIQKRTNGALSAHGIGLSEYLVLNQLVVSTNQKMRRSDLAEQVGLSPSGVTRLLNPMEKIGLVKKEENPRDARVSLVALTQAGKRIAKEAKVSFEFACVELFELLDQKKLSTFTQLLKIIAK